MIVFPANSLFEALERSRSPLHHPYQMPSLANQKISHIVQTPSITTAPHAPVACKVTNLKAKSMKSAARSSSPRKNQGESTLEPVLADAAYGAAVAAARDFVNGSGTGVPNFFRVPVPVNAQGDDEEGSSMVDSFPRDYRCNLIMGGKLEN